MSLLLDLFRQKSYLAVIVIVVFALYRSFLVQATLPVEGQKYLKTWIAGQYNASVRAKLPEPAGESERAEWLKAFVVPEDITFASLSAKGARKDHIIVKADVRIKGRHPVYEPSINYYRMDYSLLLGWRYRNRTTAFAYYSNIW